MSMETKPTCREAHFCECLLSFTLGWDFMKLISVAGKTQVLNGALISLVLNKDTGYWLYWDDLSRPVRTFKYEKKSQLVWTLVLSMRAATGTFALRVWCHRLTGGVRGGAPPSVVGPSLLWNVQLLRLHLYGAMCLCVPLDVFCILDLLLWKESWRSRKCTYRMLQEGAFSRCSKISGKWS